MSGIEPMTIEVRFFASLIDTVGSATIRLDVDPASDVQALWVRLSQMHPGLGRLSYRPMVACDLVYADWDRKLSDVREVAFLPPVSGG